MTLPELIKLNGEAVLASHLNVSVYTVRSWKNGTRIPKPAAAKAIIRHYGLGWEDIYGPVLTPDTI